MYNQPPVAVVAQATISVLSVQYLINQHPGQPAFTALVYQPSSE